jgi:hypothetical protein
MTTNFVRGYTDMLKSWLNLGARIEACRLGMQGNMRHEQLGLCLFGYT